jgi:uncharacterized repeat protein (TIGR01451 family)
MTLPWRRWIRQLKATLSGSGSRPLRRQLHVETLEDRTMPAAFTAGDLIIYRVGTGTGSLVNTGNPVFLDEYTPAGAIVQSIALPTTDSGTTHALIASGTATSEGLLTRSADGHYLTLTGYDTTTGGSTSLTGTASATVKRTVGVVDPSATADTSTILSDFADANNPRSAVSSDGMNIWVGGAAGGVRYTTIGSTTSTQLSTTVTNIRQVNIVNGQLYASDSSGSTVRLGTVGSGLPTTSGQTITNLPGFPAATGSPYNFFFADLSPAVPGVDTLYVADDAAGIEKFSLVGGTWTANGTITAASVRGLTASVNGTTVTLYGTTGGSGATGGGSLYKFTDSTGYNAAISGSASVIATAAANEAFRGVAFAPVGPTVDLNGPAVSGTSFSTSFVGASAPVAIVDAANLTVAENKGVANLSSATVTITDRQDDGSEVLAADTTGTSISASFSNGVLNLTGSDTTAHYQQVLRTVTYQDTAGNATPGARHITFSVFDGTSTSNVATSTVTVTSAQPDLTVSITGPASAATNVPFTYTITASNAGAGSAGGVTVQVTLPSGVAFSSATGSGFTANQSSGVVTFSGGGLNGNTSATLTVSVTAAAAGAITVSPGAVVIDPNNTIAESNENNNSSTATVTTQVTATSAFIHDIQGAAHISPLVGQNVTNVPGIVTAVVSNGFYMQDPNPDSDPSTSEGIFVFTSSTPTVAVGDSVLVSGKVQEFRPGGSTTDNLTNTEIGGPLSILVASHNNPLPAATIIGTGGRVPPNTVIEDDATGNVETSGTFDPASDGIDFYESLEGMRVQLNNALVVGPTARFSGDAEVYVVGDNGTNAGLRSARGGVLAQPGDFNPERIVLDGDNATIPDVKVGDRFNGPIVGIMDYDFGNFRVDVPSGGLPSVIPSALPKESTSLVGGPGQLTIATFNVENLAPSDPQSKFDGLGAAIVNNLRSPDIISVEEVQDNSGATDNGVVAADQTLAKLISAISAAGGPTYQYREIDPVDDQDGGQPGGNIRQVFLFNPNRVSFVDIPGGTSTSSTTVVNGPGGPNLSASPGRIDPTNLAFNDGGSANPTFKGSRKPLAGEFLFNGQKVFVVANHFSSKGVDDDLFGKDQPPVEVTLAQRQQQAQEVKSFVRSLLAADPNANVAVVGDLNDFEFSTTLSILDSTPLTDLNNNLAANDRYTYDFEGNSETLDHIMASAHLAGVSQIDVVHLNAEYPVANRLSDHDPVVAAFNLNPPPQANPDSYTTAAGVTLNVGAPQGVLANDQGSPLTFITTTAPGHGSLTLNPDGSFSYVPTSGFTGTDTFSYKVSDAVQLYKTNLPPLATIGGVNITAGGFGSSLYPAPGSTDEFYGVTDRGPNVDGPGGTKVEPLPDFNPAIGKFKLVNGQAILEQYIPLQGPNGEAYNGRVNTQTTTGETITDLNGNVLPPSPFGYDSEGLVALPDGSFWVSDEYGPFITHFDSTGKQIGRLSPFDNTLPAELQFRVPNRGMEGLTITPDGSTLVGIMQSALQAPDMPASVDPKKLTPLRIVTYKIATGETHEYLYLLDNPVTNKTAASEITALSNTTFLVDERDGNFPPGAYKKLYKIDITGATDVGPASTLAGSTYNGATGGLRVGGKTIENLVRSGNSGQDTATSMQTLAAAGITPVAKSLYLDVGKLLDTLDPQGRFFSHDKLEGVAALNGGLTLVISNDSDFGIDGVTNSTFPLQLHAKTSPATGQQDDGEFLMIDLSRLPAATSTATVTINVVNQAPLGASNTVATPATQAYTFAVADFGFSDPNNTPANNFKAVEITTLPGSGSLTDNGAAVVAGQFVTVADISAGLLQFTPAGGGQTSFTFQVQDDGGTAAGGMDTDQTSRTMTISVSKVAQTISFPPLGTATYGDGPITLSATGGGSGNPVAFNVVSGPGTINSNKLTINGAGAIVVEANQAGNASYLDAAPVQQTLTVNKASTSTSVVSSANPSVFGQSVTFTATVTNTSNAGKTPTGSIQFVVDGVNYGSPVALDSNGHATSAAYTFLSGASHAVKAVYSNTDGNFLPGPAGALTQTVQTVAREPDPLNPTLSDLFVGGTSKSDHIEVKLNNGQVVVDLHDGSQSIQTPLAGLTALVVYGQANNEHIEVDRHLTLAAFLFGGNGDNVHIESGGGPTVEVGGSGSNNHLEGSSARDILIAGAGGGHLEGHGGDDILIGGYTDHDHSLSVLMTVMAEWNSNDLYNTCTSVLSSYLNGATVHDDGKGDNLEGGSGMDWFFALLTGQHKDKLGGMHSGEMVVAIQ